MLDEPTNNLDIASIDWLEDFLLDFPGTVIVVSHDRHFLNTVCTHIVDIDYGKIKLYVGNYDFWYESSQLVQQLIRNKNKRNAEKIAELQAVYRPLLRQQSQEQTGHRPPPSARQADRRGDALPPPAAIPLSASRRSARSARTSCLSRTSARPSTACKLLDQVSFHR